MTEPTRARAIAEKVGTLPMLPQIAMKVMDLVADPDVQVRNLEALISRDPALVARILRLANSSFFAQRSEVQSLNRAITLMGLKQLKSLVLATSTESLFVSKHTRFKQRILWEHALGVALTARVLAHQSRKCDVEEAFTAGLLHDIGKAVLDLNLGDRFQTVLEAVYNSGESFLAAERAHLGMDHQEVGGIVLAKWNLGPALQEAVNLHHAPKEATAAPLLCATVNVANGLCVRAGIGPERRPDLDLAALDGAAMLGLRPEELESMMTLVSARLAEEKALFGVS